MSEAAVGITRDEVAHLARLARLAVTERVAGSLQLRIVDLAAGDSHTIAFDEPAYSVHTGVGTGASCVSTSSASPCSWPARWNCCTRSTGMPSR